MTVIERLRALPCDLSPLGLCPANTRFFCTPRNAVLAASLGSDGIHFCILPKEGDAELSDSPVYAVCPMNSTHVFPVAENMKQFLTFVCAEKDAGLLAAIPEAGEDEYQEILADSRSYLTENKEFADNAAKAADAVRAEFGIADEPCDLYAEVRKVYLARKNDPVEYEDEYAEICGASPEEDED